MQPTPSTLTVVQARELLRRTHLRCTSCRVAVLQFLADAVGPMSHAEVADELVPAGFDKSTIYRCLVELAEAGILSRLELGDHVWRFEYRRGHDADDEHPHFICVDCGEVSCLHDVTVQFTAAKGRAKKPLAKNVTEILLKGHCEKCL